MSHPGESGSAALFAHSIRRRGSGGERRVTPLASAPSGLAAVRLCFDCWSYFPGVFQTCAPVSANGAADTSTPLACQTLCEKASSLARAGALNLSFQGPKQTQRYQRASFQLGIHQPAAVRLPPASAGGSELRFPFHFCAAGGGGGGAVAICL